MRSGTTQLTRPFSSLHVQHKIKREQYSILFHVADRTNKGRVTLSDWAYFENILSKPDAEYEIAFRLFDVDRLGSVKYENFRKLYELNKGSDSIPFDWDCEWAKLYIGSKTKRHNMDYHQFSQMLRGLLGERVRQAFQHFDTDGDGFIEPDEFAHIIKETARHKLSDYLLENLHTLCNISQGSKVSYANVRAFLNMVNEMDLVELIVRRACAKSSDGKITRAEFLNQAAKITRFSLFTPMEADILFHFASLDQPSGRLGLKDFTRVLDPAWRRRDEDEDGRPPIIEAKTKSQQFLAQTLESAYSFALGSMAGAFGAFMVYPIDLVKTRMQNQRGASPGQRLYNNSIDCFKKVVRNEGFRGLYSGVLPQLVGVAPEKAIKLTVNDLVRGWFTDKQGNIWWGYEVIAGGAAGGCQVVSSPPPPTFLGRAFAARRVHADRSVSLPRRSSRTPWRSSRSASKSRARSPRAWRARRSARPCGSSAISASSACTRARRHVSSVMCPSRPSTSRCTRT